MQAAMRADTDEVRRTRGLELRMRVGLNAGEVVVRAIGNDLHMDYSAVGETTVLAARMEQTATPGTIRLSAATLRLVEGLVQVTALGPVPVKGLAEPVEVFELAGVSHLRWRLQAAAARGLTPFVGRQHELEALYQALSQAQAGHGQVVALVGDAGVGKSRLVYEMVHSHRTQGWQVLESASVSYGKATPYFPVIDLLKRYCHIDDGDEARTIRARVTGQVLTLDETLQDTLPALLALLDVLSDDSPFVHLDPSQRRQRTLEALRRVLLRESQVQPLLLVFEDLHWIDSETQALLDRLIESLPTAPLLLLVNYRPEYQHRWGSKTYYTQLRLDPLPPASAEAFLAGLLGGHGEEAWQHARQALDLARQQKDRGDEALALHQLGVVHAHADPPDVAQSESYYQQAMVLADELGMRPLVAHCHHGLGRLYHQSGRAEQARAALATAIDLYRTMEMTFWLPQVEAVLAQVG
jgi:hypothetical protein